MDIQSFLHENLVINQEFHAVVISIDIVSSRRLSGSDDEKENTKRAIRDIINELLGSKPMAILSWRGDGGLIICDARAGYMEIIRFCDMLIGMIPVINRSRKIYNFLPSDMIRLRIVCNYGLLKNSGDPEILSKDTIDNLFSEKTVGVIDHVVVTQLIYNQLQPEYKSRFSILPDQGTPLDPCYVLDGNLSNIEVELNEGTSEKLRDWIADMALRGEYNELLIFSYTNETLYQYVTSRLPNLRVKVLMRNWIVEREEENKFNRQRVSIGEAKTPTGILRRRWEKAHTIRAVADQLMDRDKRPAEPKVDIRFFNDKPIFKGAILKGENKTAAYIGLYSWNPERKEGGSPYIGRNWSAVWVSGNGGAKSTFLNAILSRFDELWDSGLTYEQLLQFEATRDLSHESNVNKIFSLNGSSYLIIYPGRYTKGRILPLVASEDMSAAHLIKEMLEDYDCSVSTEVITENHYSEKILNWDGHLIVLCHRSWFPGQLGYIDLDEAPYKMVINEDEPAKLYLSDLNVHVTSPFDDEPPSQRDYCLIYKRTRENNKKFIFIAGLHAIGTWGGATFLTTKQTLSGLASLIHRSDFVVIIDCEFSVPDRNIQAQILHGPRKLIEKT